MRTHFGRGRQPAWWPHGEPWPPSHRRRRRFGRLILLAALLILVLSVTGTVTLAQLTAQALGLSDATGGRAAVILLTSGILSIGFIALALAALARRVTMPLGGVMDAADRVAAGDYDVHVAEHGSPPIRGLARAFNAMTARLRDHDRLRRDLMADIAHELRTPLTVIQGKLEGLLDGVYARDDATLRQLAEETHVLSRLVDDLRTLALSESGALKLQREPTDVGELARDVARGFEAEGQSRQVTVSVEAVSGPATVEADPVRVREVIGNLLSNAMRHAPSDSRIDVRIAAAPDGVSVAVQDRGVGMTEEALAHAFDRFYKGPESRGSGLGLAIAKGLVAAHGGEIHAVSAVGQGTTVSFTLPGRS